MRVRFKHASASRSHTQNVIVELRDESGLCGYGEGCPREYVTGETQTSAKAFLAKHGPEALTALDSLTDLRRWIDENEALIDANPAAFCAFDLAALDLLGKRAGMPLEQLLGLPPLSAPIAYTAVMGDSSPGKARAMVHQALSATRSRHLGRRGACASGRYRISQKNRGGAWRKNHTG
jgi:L-alanine-DL-glutamate epimerase-like enolase superfamily enzyme